MWPDMAVGYRTPQEFAPEAMPKFGKIWCSGTMSLLLLLRCCSKIFIYYCCLNIYILLMLLDCCYCYKIVPGGKASVPTLLLRGEKRVCAEQHERVEPSGTVAAEWQQGRERAHGGAEASAPGQRYPAAQQEQEEGAGAPGERDGREHQRQGGAPPVSTGSAN